MARKKCSTTQAANKSQAKKSSALKAQKPKSTLKDPKLESGNIENSNENISDSPESDTALKTIKSEANDETITKDINASKASQWSER